MLKTPACTVPKSRVVSLLPTFAGRDLTSGRPESTLESHPSGKPHSQVEPTLFSVVEHQANLRINDGRQEMITVRAARKTDSGFAHRKSGPGSVDE